MASFERETQTVAALNHRNISANFGVEDNDIVMDLVEGRLPGYGCCRFERRY